MTDSYDSNEICSVKFAKNKPLVFETDWHPVARIIRNPKDYELLGVVRQGMSFGLLGIAPDGRYVRINGHIIEPLNERKIRQLLPQFRSATKYRTRAASMPKSARVRTDQMALQSSLQSSLQSPPVITVRKRRTIQKAPLDTPCLQQLQACEAMQLARTSQYVSA